jgi:hypothetical protein
VLNREPVNDAPIGGIKIIAESGRFAARPSGTEAIYKVYAESFKGEDHPRDILREARIIVDAVLATDTTIAKPPNSGATWHARPRDVRLGSENGHHAEVPSVRLYSIETGRDETAVVRFAHRPR